MAIVKRARRKDRNRPVGEMLLMMWRSSRREIVKIRRAEKALEGEEEQDGV